MKRKLECVFVWGMCMYNAETGTHASHASALHLSYRPQSSLHSWQEITTTTILKMKRQHRHRQYIRQRHKSPGPLVLFPTLCLLLSLYGTFGPCIFNLYLSLLSHRERETLPSYYKVLTQDLFLCGQHEEKHFITTSWHFQRQQG